MPRPCWALKHPERMYPTRCKVCTVPFNRVRTSMYGTRATVALIYQLLQFRLLWCKWRDEWRDKCNEELNSLCGKILNEAFRSEWVPSPLKRVHENIIIIGDPLETNMPDREPIQYLSETYWRPFRDISEAYRRPKCLVGDPSETDMPQYINQFLYK